MTAFGSLEHIFDKPFPENQSFLESLSPWKHIRPSSIGESTIIEIFGELHFKENNHPRSPLESPPSSSLASTSTPPARPARPGAGFPGKGECRGPNTNLDPYDHLPSSPKKKQYGHSDSFSSMSSEGLSVCTEGLGFESFGDVEDLGGTDLVMRGERRCRVTRNIIRTDKGLHGDHHPRRRGSDYLKRSRICRGDFPPPISCIGRSGKPWVFFKSYRQEGRLVLKEIRIPTQEFLHACREDGRLRLQFIHSDDEIFEDEDDDEDDDKEENLGVGNCDFPNSS